MSCTQTMQVGDTYRNVYGDYTVIKYENSKRVRIKFNKTGSKIYAQAGDIRRGNVNDPYAPSVENIGYMGIGDFSKKSHPKLYSLWRSTHVRCYSGRYSTYNGCTVSKRWQCYQLFCQDILKYKNWNTKEYQLDKDLKVIGNTVYGRKYCSFVPRVVNNFIRYYKPRRNGLPQGVYKFGNSYESHVEYKRKVTHLGTFSTIKEAEKAYLNGKVRIARRIIKEYGEDMDKDVKNNLIIMAASNLYA